MVELVGVSKRFRGREAPVLDGISLAMKEGEIVVVSGPSGVGKTTLLSLVTGRLRADEGEARVFGHDLSRLRASSMPALHRRIAFVPQELCLLENRTVFENVVLPLAVGGIARRVARIRVADALAMVGLQGMAPAPVKHLSTGERRRVSLARALVAEPELLVLDEPDANLDASRRDELCSLLEDMRGSGLACLIATNEPQVFEVGGFCGWRGFELFAGKLKEAALLGSAIRAVTMASDRVIVPLRTAQGGMRD